MPKPDAEKGPQLRSHHSLHEARQWVPVRLLMCRVPVALPLQRVQAPGSELPAASLAAFLSIR